MLTHVGRGVGLTVVRLLLRLLNLLGRLTVWIDGVCRRSLVQTILRRLLLLRNSRLGRRRVSGIAIACWSSSRSRGSSSSTSGRSRRRSLNCGRG